MKILSKESQVMIKKIYTHIIILHNLLRLNKHIENFKNHDNYHSLNNY